MIEIRKNLCYRLTGPLLFIISLAVYFLTLSHGAYPGESAFYIVHFSGIQPRLSPDSPLLHLLTRLISCGPSASLSLRLNLFSAVCGAGVIWLIFQLVSIFVYTSVEKNPVNTSKAGTAALLAGFVAAVSLAFSVPFWSISTRYHVAAFHVLLFLLLTRLFIKYIETGSRKLLLLFAFLYGIGIVEYPPFVPFAFLFGPFILFWLWVREEFEPKIIVKLVCCALLGLSFYFLSAWTFYGSETYNLMDQMSYFRVLRIILRDQYYFLTRILPQSGWLIIVLVTIVPWFTCLFMARRGLNEDPNPSLFILHLMITILSVCTLFNLDFVRDPISRAFMFLVLPYVLTASLFGYLAAYWFMLPSVISSATENKLLLWIRNRMGYVFAAPFMVSVIVLSVLNFNVSDGRKSEFLDHFSTSVLDTMDDAKWLITNGSIDDNLLVKVFESGRDIKVINIARTKNDVYLKYVGSMLKTPILQSYAEVGIMPMLRSWLSSDENAYKDIAIFNMPDLWRALGYQPLPDRLVFRAYTGTIDDPEAVYKKHVDFWQTEKTFLNMKSNDMGDMAYLYQNCVRHMGFVANNLGVALEDNSLEASAFAAYSKAREIDDENISALLNQSMMIDRGYVSDASAEIKKKLTDVVKAGSRKYGLWTLSHMYGYVRHPDVLARQGMTWALSGQPDMAVAGLKQVENMMPVGNRQGVRNLLAQAYVSAGRPDESETVYKEILAGNPGDRRAIMGMARIALMRNDLADAKKYLDMAEKAGVPEGERNAEWATIAIRAGDFDRARVILEKALLEGSNSVRLLTLLADVLAQQNDQEELVKCLNRIEDQEGGRMMASLLRGELALGKKDIKVAYSHLERALSYQPDNLYIIEKLLRLDFVMRNKSRTYQRVRTLLNVNPNHAFANYVLAVIKMSEKDYELAEASLRKSIQSQETPEALNDLAWLLFEKEKYEEAEKMVRKSLVMKENLYTAWDTLGEIMFKQDKIEEAEKALQKAMSLFNQDYRVHLHMAELQLAKGNKKDARDLLDIVFSKINLLPVDDHKKVVELRRLCRE